MSKLKKLSEELGIPFIGTEEPETMEDRYGDGSDHKVCQKCNMCLDCGDCECDEEE